MKTVFIVNPCAGKKKDIKNFTFRLEIPTPEQFKNIQHTEITNVADVVNTFLLI